MIEDASTMEAQNAMILDGLAVGVDHLEAIVVFLRSVAHTYASWTRPGSELRAAHLGMTMQAALEVAERTLEATDPSPGPRATPTLTIESPARLTLVRGVRAFGVAICFERDVPLGFARMAAERIVTTLAQELPFPPEGPSVQIAPSARPTTPSSPPAAPQLDFAVEPPPDTVGRPTGSPPASNVGHRVREVVRYVSELAPDRHLVRLRLALRSGLGMEALDAPDVLEGDALLLVETAAEDILGKKLPEVLP